MSLLVAMRVLTLVGWLALAGCSTYVVKGPGRALSAPVRWVWTVLAVRQAVIALTTVMVESTWVLSVVAPDSWLVALGKGVYDPAYLANAALDAVTPFLIVSFLACDSLIRRSGAVAVATAAGLFTIAILTGATGEWAVLMSWAQVYGFMSIVGYLTFWGLTFLGNLMHPGPYLLGLLATSALFAILLPVQSAFFTLVGREDVAQIWHLHEFLQLVLVSAKLSIVVAFIQSRGSEERMKVVGARV
ncbi:MAG TPA: hypothetical protein VF158_06100 [Longimicrobiales bacterium]